jgi:hypothetical protein
MKSHPSPIGFRNNFWLIKSAEGADKIIAAWGVSGKHLNRNQEAETIFETLWCLGTTKDGYPRHPLFVKKDFKPIQYHKNQKANELRVLTDLYPSRSLTDFQRNTKSHLKRLEATGRPEILTVNGKAGLIVQNAAAYADMIDAIRGIQRGLDSMSASQGEPARKVLDRIRAKHKIPRASR